MKLAAWTDDETFRAGDLDWAWCPGLRSEGLAELRVTDPLGGYANGLRLVFYPAEQAVGDDAAIIWGLHALPLTAAPLSQTAVEIARLRHMVVIERYYR